MTSSPGNLAHSAIEGLATAPVNGEKPEVGIILFNMGAVDKIPYANIANVKHEVSLDFNLDVSIVFSVGKFVKSCSTHMSRDAGWENGCRLDFSEISCENAYKFNCTVRCIH